MRVALIVALGIGLVACARVPAAPQGPALVDAPAAGPVAPFVAAQLGTSSTAGRRVLVYVGATWCEPCERFKDAVKAHTLDGLLGGVDVLVFDADRDRDRLEAAGYGSRMIPLFVVPNADGTASPARHEGAIKGDGAVAFLTPRLESLLGRARP